MTHLHTIEIPALKGTKVIADSKLFSYIDPDFKNWSADKKGKATKKMKLDVFEMDKDATLAEMMSPDNLLTQEQILYLVENHKDLLHPDGYATLFPFKSGEEVFVVNVYVHGVGRLGVDAYRLSRDDVWYAGDRHRIVIPKITSKEKSEIRTFDLTLSSSEREALKGVLTKLLK